MDEKEEMEAEFRELLKGVAAEEQQELKSMTEGGELGFTMSEDLEAEHTNLLRQSGLNVEQLELQERKDAEATEKWIAEVTPALVMGDEQQPVLQQLAEEREMSLDQSLAGEDMEILAPVGFTVSDSDTMTMDLVGAVNEKEEIEAEFRELLKEVAAEEQQELKSMTEGGELGLKMSEDLESEYTNLLRQSGLNVEQLELQERKDAEATEKWIAEVTPALVMGDEQQPVLQQLAEEREMSLDQSLAGEDMEILAPVGFTISDSDTMTMDWIPPSNKVCQKVYVSICGDGWGCVGGIASRRICVDWWYAFKPRWNKFYAIVPRVTYNGYYIVRADDKWYNCKYARAKIDIGVNVYQFNWKGWSWWNVLNVEDSNISVRRRIDTVRRVNYAALLRRNDRTWIRVRTCLDVYAKGSVSYAELNFSTGSNQIRAPWLYVG